MEVDNPQSGGVTNPILQQTLILFAEALADDLNISVALAALFDMVREINILCDARKLGREEANQVLEFMKCLDTVLGVLSFEKQVDAIPQELHEALARRIQARKDKDWTLADNLRDFITSRGYVIEDTPGGVRLKKAG
jgi:cysteinyl-tRNA synthetase